MSEKYYIGWDDFHRHTKNSPDKSNRPEISTKLLLSAAVAFCLRA